MSHAPKQPSTKIVALRVPVEQIAFLREQAKANERTVSGEIRRLIRQAIDQEREAA